MDSEAIDEGLELIDFICCPDEPCDRGKFTRVSGFQGKCIGDCAATIHSEVLRIVAFQVAGRIGDINGWVIEAVLQLQRSGAHVGVFSETRIQTSDRHSRIVNAFKENGYIAISHNSLASHAYSVDATDESVFGPRAAGVIIVVSAKHITGWANVALDTCGRSIAANLDAQDGSTVRIIGAYGVSGSNCINFASFPSKVKAESLLNQFISEQVSYCSRNGIHVIVAGDLNSYQRPAIDHYGGPSNIRPGCITSHLSFLGFCDTFRHRHPSVHAFTHISKAGGSRLDQIWIRSATGLPLFISLSCIIWEWDLHSDHFPVVADIHYQIPLITTSVVRVPQPPWRTLLSNFNDDEHRDTIRSEVLENITPHKDLIESHRRKLAILRLRASSRDTMDPTASRDVIESAFLAIENNMLEAIPWPKVKQLAKREVCQWQCCARLLQRFQKDSYKRHLPRHRIRNTIKKLNASWHRRILRTIALSDFQQSGRTYPSDATITHPFYSTPLAWAADLGFPSPSANQWVISRIDPHDVSISNAVDPLTCYPQVAIVFSERCRLSAQKRSALLVSLRFPQAR